MTINYINKKPGISDLVITPPASNLLFSSNFSGAPNLAAWAVSGTAARNLSGTDTETGFTWPTSGMGFQALGSYGSSIILINNYATAATVVAGANNYGTVTIQSEPGPDGPNENVIRLNLLDSGLINNGSNVAFGGQMHIQIGRVTDGISPGVDLDNLYMTYYFKRSSTLFNSMATNNVAVQWDFKSGGYNNLYGGDFRMYMDLYKHSNGNVYSAFIADRAANGSMTAAPDGILPFNIIPGDSTSAFRYWREANDSVAILPDVWNKLEIFINRHEKNGVLLSAINDQIVCKHVGRTLGEFGNIWGRLFALSCYGNSFQSDNSMCRFRCRDYPPAGSVLQIPAAILLDRYAE